MRSNTRNLRLWAREDGSGNIIPGSVQARPRGYKPSDGRWILLGPVNQCCSCDCLITFRLSTANTTITAISSSDGSVDWTGTITNGGQKSFVNSNCFDQVYTVTMSAPGGTLTVTGTVAQGTGVITPLPTSIPSGASPVTTVVTADGGTCAEYLVVIS